MASVTLWIRYNCETFLIYSNGKFILLGSKVQTLRKFRFCFSSLPGTYNGIASATSCLEVPYFFFFFFFALYTYFLWVSFLVVSVSLWPHGPLQALLSMEFSRQEYWSELPVPFPGDLPDPGIEPGSPILQADSLPSEPPGWPNPTFLILVQKSHHLRKWWSHLTCQNECFFFIIVLFLWYSSYKHNSGVRLSSG